MSKEKNILIGCTGSVATIKLPILVKTIQEELLQFYEKININVIVTEKAKHFLSTSEEITVPIKLYSDEDEWNSWQNRGDPVVHVDLAKWADIFVIAPLDANTLAKISQGLCDNLLTCTARAWIMKKPFLFCPAMNTRMWEHPITCQQISTLKNWGYVEVPCISKSLMCGDSGMGAMAEVPTIVQYIKQWLTK